MFSISVNFELFEFFFSYLNDLSKSELHSATKFRINPDQALFWLIKRKVFLSVLVEITPLVRSS